MPRQPIDDYEDEDEFIDDDELDAPPGRGGRGEPDQQADGSGETSRHVPRAPSDDASAA